MRQLTFKTVQIHPGLT